MKSEIDSAPVGSFSGCHAGIIEHMDAFARLPALLKPAEEARSIAERIRQFFSDVILTHHQEEERELFTAVMASASSGEELEQVRTIITRLTAEHRELERCWARIEPQMKTLARGELVPVDTQAIDQLTVGYKAHAEYEEQHFLPLAEKILGRNENHMAALGMSLHMRRSSKRAVGYI
jgi:hemerythrin-like domain-containing protein